MINMAEIERIVCPLCMHNYLKEEVISDKRFNFFDTGKNHFVLIETTKGGKIAGTGKGYRGSAKATGFEVFERLTIEEALNTGRYNDEIMQIKNQIIKLAREFIRLGLMKKNDI